MKFVRDRFFGGQGTDDAPAKLYVYPRGNKLSVIGNFTTPDNQCWFGETSFGQASDIQRSIDDLRAVFASLYSKEGLTPDFRSKHSFDAESPEEKLVWGTILPRLAKAGRMLYFAVFNDDLDEHNLADIGHRFSMVTNSGVPTLVSTKDIHIPWNLMYVEDPAQFSRKPAKELAFVGMRGLLTETATPRGKNDLPVLPVEDANEKNLDVVAYAGETFDGDKSFERVGKTLSKRLDMKRVKSWDVFEQDAQSGFKTGIMVFYGHAAANEPSSFTFENSGQKLNYHTLLKSAQREDQDNKRYLQAMYGRPLVIICACSSNTTDARYYGTLPTGFLALGAGACLGVSADVPGVLASYFARGVITLIWRGKIIQDAVATLSQRLLDRHSNPLGMLFSVYGDRNFTLCRPKKGTASQAH